MPVRWEHVACWPRVFADVGSDAVVKRSFVMTGEWCTSPGSYVGGGPLNRTAFEALTASTANVARRCDRLTEVTCYKSRDSLRENYKSIQASAALLRGAAKPPVAHVAAVRPESTSTPGLQTLQQVSTGGRRLLM